MLVDFYLASRGEYVVDDFDERGVRNCKVVRDVDGVFIVEVEPPINDDGQIIATVALIPRWHERALPPSPGQIVPVHVVPYADTAHAIHRDELRSRWWGEVALDTALFLPTSAEEAHDIVERVRRFAESNGRVGPPFPDTEEGLLLQTLVRNLRLDYAEGDLEPEIEAQLEAIPGWTWSDPSLAGGGRFLRAARL